MHVTTKVWWALTLVLASVVNYFVWLGWNPLGREGDIGYNGGTYDTIQVIGVSVVELALLITVVWRSRARWIALIVPFVWTGLFAAIEMRRCDAYGCDGLWSLGAVMLFGGTFVVCLIVGLVTHQLAVEHRDGRASNK